MEYSASQRMQQVQSPVIPIIGEWIAQHPGTISLGQGVVHFPPPPSVAEAVARAAADTTSLARYGPVRGHEELLQKIESKLIAENGISAMRQRIVFTAGGNMAFLNAVLAIADCEDEIVLLSPYYFNHHMAVEIAGCRPVIVATNDAYQIDIDAVAAALTTRTRAVVTVSPNNPTGAVYSRDALSAVNRLCLDHGCYHISDEAYEYFNFGDEPHFSPASLPNSETHTISLFSLSKAYGMAGWRCGYMAIPQQLEIAVKKIQDTNLICPPQICQIAALAALDAGREWCRMKIKPLIKVRAQVLDELKRLGSRCRMTEPTGAFYVLLQLESATEDIELVRTLIEDYRVAVLPGSTFGIGDQCTVRVAYGSLQPAKVAEGIHRLVQGLQNCL